MTDTVHGAMVMGLVRLLCYMCFIGFWTLKCTERSVACIPAIEQTDQWKHLLNSICHNLRTKTQRLATVRDLLT